MVLFLPVLALVGPSLGGAELDAEKAQKLEVRDSMIGYRSTLQFYTFEEEKLILKLVIGNEDKTFPITGTVYRFEDTVTGEDLKKWINNQHSDALFVDAPKPLATVELPEEGFKLLFKKETGRSRNPGLDRAVYQDFEIKFMVREHRLDEDHKLKSFTGQAQVHVKDE